MRFLYFFVFLVLVFSGCESHHDEFIIRGRIRGLSNGYALLQRRVNSKFQTMDSSTIKNGKFTFKGKIDSPEMCYIQIADSVPLIRLFIENSRIDVEAHIDSLRNPEINGSHTQDLLASYNAYIAPYDNELQEIYAAYLKAYQRRDTADARILEAQFDQVAEKQKKESLKFIKANSGSVVSPYLVWGTLAYDLDVEELEAISTEFSPEVQKSIYVRQIKDYIQTLKKVDIGQPFIEIALPDTTGQIRKLSDLKGNLVLIDFWASWCKPCRRENPYVVSLYNEFKDHHFEIFGISLDEKKRQWEKAIVEDRLSWYHVSDLKGWDCEAGKAYGVRAIPHTVLVNRKGIIIAKNLRGEELREKIEELLKN